MEVNIKLNITLILRGKLNASVIVHNYSELSMSVSNACLENEGAQVNLIQRLLDELLLLISI